MIRVKGSRVANSELTQPQENLLQYRMGSVKVIASVEIYL